MDQLDQGYAWVVLAAAILQHLLYACPLGILGIFLVEIREHFQCTKSQITLLAMLSFVVGMLLAYPLGKLTQRFGTRRMSLAAALLSFTGYVSSAYAPRLEVLYLVYGALTSISHYAQYVVDIAAVQQWFDRKRGLAIGLLMAAASVGSFMWPPVASTLIRIYGWQGALFIISAVQLHGLVFGLFLRPVRTKKRKPIADVMKTPDISLRLMARRLAPFGLLLISVGLIQAGYFVFITYLPLRMHELGMENSQVSLLFSVIGAVGIVLRPLVGVIGDYPQVSRLLFYGICAALGGALTVASTVFRSSAAMASYAAGCGVTSAGYMAIQAALAVDLLGRKYNEVGIGALVTSMGIAHTILHPVSGWLMDAYQDSALPFCIFGACQLIGGFIAVAVYLLQRHLSISDDLKIEIPMEVEYKFNSDAIIITSQKAPDKA